MFPGSIWKNKVRPPARAFLRSISTVWCDQPGQRLFSILVFFFVRTSILPAAAPPFFFPQPFHLASPSVSIQATQPPQFTHLYGRARPQDATWEPVYIRRCRAYGITRWSRRQALQALGGVYKLCSARPFQIIWPACFCSDGTWLPRSARCMAVSGSKRHV